MKRLTYCTALLVPAFFSQISLAQVPLQSNFDLVADIAQAVLPLEFNPPTTTQAVDAAGKVHPITDLNGLAENSRSTLSKLQSQQSPFCLVAVEIATDKKSFLLI